MKRVITVFGLLAILLAAISLSSYADDKTNWTGWISDSHCGAKGTSAGHKACAGTCVKANGATWVFVDSKNSKVYPIKNQGSIDADKDLGHPVTVTGRLNSDGSLSVDSLVEAKM
ncbi:MAG TPA: hypothetical protein VEJ45_08385 [Candidatus Acidoferrales bacterium]|nr:hypothetical protein [Candidatus Acidoferrales bacterium]